MIYELVLRNFDCSLEFVLSLLLLQPFNFSPVSFACNFQDWECVILREIDFLSKICWSIPCLHPSWKVHTSIKRCCFQVKRYYVDFRANVHITDVIRGANENKITDFLPKIAPLFLPHNLLFDHWMQLTITPTCTAFLLLASLSRDLLRQHSTLLQSPQNPAFFQCMLLCLNQGYSM